MFVLQRHLFRLRQIGLVSKISSIAARTRLLRVAPNHCLYKARGAFIRRRGIGHIGRELCAYVGKYLVCNQGMHSSCRVFSIPEKMACAIEIIRDTEIGRRLRHIHQAEGAWVIPNLQEKAKASNS